jgi:hypothetical protein
MKCRMIWLSGCLCIVLAVTTWPGLPMIELRRDDTAGRLQVIIDGREAFVYQYAETLDLPHYWPMNSPLAKNMLVQQTEPYPHHRSFWFADTVRLDGGREVSTYNALYTGKETEPKTYGPPFRDHIRHIAFTRMESGEGRAVIDAQLLWEMDGRKAMLEERRHMIVQALGKGEYLLDIAFTLIAAGGDVEFVSDDVHYAWPYLRLQTRWSGENGGTITASTGATGQEATNLKTALWIDYSNTVEGETAGVTIFQWPDGQEHRWLTREYGCFGPRRPDDRSGKPFTLEKGESITQRVAVLVHSGDMKTGRVAERYQQYVEGQRQ